MHRVVRMPSQVRRFEGHNFHRLVSTFNADNNAVLQNLAKRARRIGYNARLVKNKNSSSIYIKPRKYNAPIPETDPVRIATFPTAFEGVMNRRGGRTFEPTQRDKDIWEKYPELVKNQAKEILMELQQIESIEGSINEDLDEISFQAELNEVAISMGDQDLFESNLNDEQWNVLLNKVYSGEAWNSDVAERRMVERTLGEYAWIQDPDIKDITKYPVEQEYSVTRIGNMYQLFSEDGVLLRTYSDDFYDRISEGCKNKIKNEYKEQIVYGFRELGVSEHLVYAGIVTEDREKRIETLQDRMQNYEQWDGYDAAVLAMSERLYPTEIPAMIDLPVVEQNEVMPSEQEAIEIINDVAGTIDMEEITIKANNIREVLETLGFNRPEVNPGNVTTLNESRTGRPVFVARENENPTDRPPGYTWVSGHFRKLPVRSRNTSSSMDSTEVRTAYTRPKTGRGSNLRNRVARFIWDEVYVQGNEPPSTGQVVQHINENTSWGASTSQVSNILGKDVKTFEKAGFDPKSKQETWRLKKPQKT
tara:strand:+ start:1849 stop:3447 length:1599 start_codon:yes stop_codon:yes gene_type:complete